MIPWKIAKGLFEIAADPEMDMDLRYQAARFLVDAKGDISTPNKSEVKKLKGIKYDVPPEVQAILNKTAERRQQKGKVQC